jgi:hypothetical protein
MKRRRPLAWISLGMACFSLLLMAAGGFCAWALRQVPDFYGQAHIGDLEQRQELADDFVRHWAQIVNALSNRDQPFATEFQGPEINAWLQRDLAHRLAPLVSDEYQDVRLVLEGDRFRLGARLRVAGVEAIGWVEGTAWLSRPNVIALRLDHVQLGALPVPRVWLARRLMGILQEVGFETELRSHEGSPVVLVDLGPSAREQVELLELRLRDGTLLVTGRRARPQPQAQPASSAAVSGVAENENDHSPSSRRIR